MHFEDFELDLRAGELRRGPEKVRLQEQPYRILTMLLEHPGEVVLRDEICKRLWPNGTIVEVSHGINAAVQRLREALGDSAVTPRFVETVARRGYRFVAPVQVEFRGTPQARPPASQAPAEEISAGQIISHFRLEEKLGCGAMGVVYRAEDLNLSRRVALKFLVPETAGDPQAVSRFQREARTASALNHPNICTVYAVEEVAGQPAIVMELLEGRTLESILTAGPIPALEVLKLAIQMAAALDAAQRKGIVHRDLKPGNVMVTEFGVKVLDFGLAKQSLSGRSTMTNSGSIAGTPKYMAPELFQGREADSRSDLYSFGVVLQEMLTGSTERRELPAGMSDVAAVIRRALEPDPANRWQTAGDLKAALEAVLAARNLLPVSRTVSSQWGRIAATAVLAAVLLGWFATTPRRRAADPPMPPEMRATPAGMMTRPALPARAALAGSFHLSPDGKRIAYADGGDIRIRATDEVDGQIVASLPGTSGSPFWSPDGSSLAFTNNGHLYTVAVSGGTAKRVGDVNTSIGGTWGRDGTILIGEIGGGLLAFSGSGGTMRLVTTPDAGRGETRHLFPQFLPDGRHFIYTAGSNQQESSALYAGSLDSDQRVRLMPIESGAIFVEQAGPAGYLVFVRDSQILAQKFDAAALRLSGEPERVGGPVGGSRAASATAITIPDLSATRTVLAYRQAKRATVSLASLSLIPRPLDVVILKNWMPRQK